MQILTIQIIQEKVERKRERGRCRIRFIDQVNDTTSLSDAEIMKTVKDRNAPYKESCSMKKSQRSATNNGYRERSIKMKTLRC